MIVIFIFLSILVIAFLLMLCLLLLKIEKMAVMATLIAERFIVSLYGKNNQR